MDLPDPTWFELADLAEEREIDVSWLIAHAIHDLLGTEHTRLAVARARRERDAALARHGLTDAVICERTGETRDYVATNRRKAGIAPNRPGRANTRGRQHEQAHHLRSIRRPGRGRGRVRRGVSGLWAVARNNRSRQTGTR